MAIPQEDQALTDHDISSGPSQPGHGSALDVQGHDFEPALTDARETVDRALEGMPDSLAQARARIVQEFWPAPRPEELQTIVRIANDPVRKGARSEVCRELLAIRILTEREGREFWDGALDDSSDLRRSGDILGGALVSLIQIDESLTLAQGGMGLLGAEDLEPLQRTMKFLAPPREPILGGALLAARVAAILDAGSEAELRAAVPSLTEDELRAIRSSDGPAGNSPLRRSALEVAALRWILDELVAAWDKDANAPSPEPSEDGASPVESGFDLSAAGELMAAHAPGQGSLSSEMRRTELLRRVQELEVVYTLVSGRLQKLQDAALIARRKEEADGLFKFRRPLSASHAKLAPILQHLRSQGQSKVGHTAGTTDPAAAEEDAASGIDVNVGDGEVDAIFQNALAEDTAPAAEQQGHADALTNKRRSRSRVAMLGSIAAALFIVAALVYDLKPAPPPPPLEFSPSDSIALKLTATESIGTMLYAQVTEAWDGLSESERLREVDDLSRTALDHGFFAIHLVGQDRETVADWTRESGTRLAVPRAEPDTAGSDPSAPDTDAATHP